MTTYYEDLEPGDVLNFDGYEMTREEIVEFAAQYDPQPFHVDEDAARASMFGGLIASGWHTASATMRLVVDNVLSESAARGAIGVDELRWTQPVRPGDSLGVELEVLDKEPWEGDLGLVRIGYSVTTDDGTEVMSMIGLVLYEMREG